MPDAHRNGPKPAWARHRLAYWGLRPEELRPSARETPRNRAGIDGRVSVAGMTASFGQTRPREPESRKRSPSDRWDSQWRLIPAKSRASLRGLLLHETCSSRTDWFPILDGSACWRRHRQWQSRACGDKQSPYLRRLQPLNTDNAKAVRLVD